MWRWVQPQFEPFFKAMIRFKYSSDIFTAYKFFKENLVYKTFCLLSLVCTSPIELKRYRFKKVFCATFILLSMHLIFYRIICSALYLVALKFTFTKFDMRKIVVYFRFFWGRGKALFVKYTKQFSFKME